MVIPTGTVGGVWYSRDFEDPVRPVDGVDGCVSSAADGLGWISLGSDGKETGIGAEGGTTALLAGEGAAPVCVR
jgi:hypothetical protein